MNHPNIAKFMDGGTWEGRPYLVMEYIRGDHIDEFCKKKNLDIHKKTALFLKVCQAVAYAHQSGKGLISQ